MEYELHREDEEGRPFIVTVEIEYDATPEEYEAGYYFAGGIEYHGATVLDFDMDPEKTGTEAEPECDVIVGKPFRLTDSEIDSVCDEIRSNVVENRGRYPRIDVSPDW